MSKLAAFLFLFLTISLQAQIEFEMVNPMPTTSPGLGIVFISDETGFIVTYNSLLQTTNSGLTWNVKDPTVGGSEIKFYNNIGIITSTNGDIYRSIDYGETWNLINLGILYNFMSINMIDASNIVLAYPNGLIRSFDGGLSWNTITTPSGNSVVKCFFTSNTTGHIVTTAGKIFKTIDGGATWAQTSSMENSPEYYRSIFFVNEQLGFAARGQGTILKTIDGGTTWVVNDNWFNNVYSFYFLNETTGYVLAEYYTYKTVDGGSTWTVLELPYSGIPGYDLRSMWTTANGNAYACGDRGRILRSTDSGESWMPYSPTYNDIFQLSFPTDNIGYALTASECIKTINGGTTWSNLGEISTGKEITSMQFVTAEVGFAIGGRSLDLIGHSNVVYKTLDGGNIWSATTIPDFEDSLYSMFFIDHNIGFVSGGYNTPTTFKTIDGGVSWTAIPYYGFESMKFIDSLTGYGSRMMHFYKTVDGGNTWDLVFTAPEGDIYGFDFPNANTGFVGGSEGLAVRTMDGGVTWQDMPAFTSAQLEVKFFNTQEGLIAAGNGIFKTIDAGVTWTTLLGGFTPIEIRNEMIYTYHNSGYIAKAPLSGMFLNTVSNNAASSPLKLYPNPATDSVTIVIPNQYIQSVEVTDLAGRTIMREEIKGKSSKELVNISALQNGVFLIHIKSQSGVDTVSKLVVNH